MKITPPTIQNAWTGKVHYMGDHFTQCGRSVNPIQADWRETTDPVDCATCIKSERAGRDYRELRLLRLSQADMLAALLEIEAHHVEQNRIKGRDESRSATLRIARTAIEKATQS